MFVASLVQMLLQAGFSILCFSLVDASLLLDVSNGEHLRNASAMNLLQRHLCSLMVMVV